MEKKGQVGEVLAGIMIILTIFGAVAIINEDGKAYVGNNANKVAYEYHSCKDEVNNIPEKNRIVFDSYNEAKKEGYELKENCKWLKEIKKQKDPLQKIW